MAVIDGTAGNDPLSGTVDNDTINGLAGNDTLDGLDGDDSLVGGDGNDTLGGGNGADTIEGGNANDTLDGGDGTDSLVGGTGLNNLIGGNGADTLLGGPTSDTLSGGAGVDLIDGGNGTDFLQFFGGSSGVIVDLPGGTAQDDFGFVDTLSSIETVFGGSFNDSITGGDEPNFIAGQGANDTLVGAGGDDVLRGGAGGDRLVGGDGNDTITGDGGLDTGVFEGARGGYTINFGLDSSDFGFLREGVSQTFVTQDGGGAQGADSLRAIARFAFDDVTIADPPFLAVTTTGIAEGNAGTTNLVFTVTLSVATTQDVRLGFATSDGTALAGTDYVATTGVVAIPAGQSSAQFTVPLIGDDVIEPYETFLMTLSDPVGALFRGGATPSQAIGVIANDDGGVSAGDDFANDISTTATVAIGQPLLGNFETSADQDVFRVALEAGTLHRINLDGRNTGIGATRNPSLVLLDGTGAQVAANDNAGNGTLDALIQFTPAASGDFFISARTAINDASGIYRLSVTTAADLPEVDISGFSVAEGDAGGLVALFTITRSLKSNQAVSVTATTANGTATAGEDFTQTSSVVTIAGGADFATFAVPILADSLNEADETFTITLSDPVNAALGANAVASGTILDDDGARLGIAAGTAVEGNSGTRSVNFSVRLSDGIAAADTVVTYSTANGTAIAGADFTGANGGTVTIPAGAASATIAVPVNGDALFEADEDFSITVTGTDNAEIAVDPGAASATGTIVNDDPFPIPLSIADAALSEGNGGSANLVFTISLASPAAQAVSVTASAQAGSAIAGADYSPASSAVTIAAGETSATFSVPVFGDTALEIDEVFFVALSSPGAGAILNPSGSIAAGRILNDDQAALPAVTGQTINGTSGDDFLVGSALNDSIAGQAGADTEFGNEQSDVLVGGTGDDFIVADFPANFLFGSADFVDAGDGNDNVFGGGGGDTLIGGNGDDLLAADTGDNLIFGGDGDNALYGFDGADTILGGNNGDIVFGLPGPDVIVTQGGLDLIIAGGDTDGAGDADFTDMGSGGGSVFAGSGNDTIVAGDGEDFMLGESGADVMRSGANNDVLIAGPGNDTLDGGEGSDILIAEGGNNSLTGGGGFDSFRYPAGIAVDADRILDFAPAEDTVELAAALGFATGAAALAAVTQTGADAVLTVIGGSITFVGINIAELTAADLVII